MGHEARPVIEQLPPRDAAPPEAALVEEVSHHPMRFVTRAVAADIGAWEPSTARDVRALFDELSEEWHTRHASDHLLPVEDALERGGDLRADGVCLELGSGDGWATPLLAARFPRLVAVDLSIEMLRRAPDAAPRVQADGAALPFADDAVDVAVLVNTLLFPRELDRVLGFDGALVWVSSRAEATPIHLTADEVAAALPGRWSGVASRAGTGTWTVLRRAG